jgi:dolichyl-diphosphooligosaccharide--protein glycosyltransferase
MTGPVRFLERRLVRAALLFAVLGVAAAVRFATWPWVQGGDEVRIVGDGDVLYHLVQAQRLVTEGVAAVWRDPGLNFPLGADVPWPPLFDALLAGAGWLTDGGAAPDRAALVAGAVWVPAILGVLMVLLLAWLGRALLGGRPWLDAALVLALLPSHAMMTALGRADQHALEPVLLGLMVLAAARLARGAGRGAMALLALSAALAFWNWNGSALYLALLGGFAAAWHALAAPGEEAPGRTAQGLAIGFLAGAVLLAGSVALLGPASAIRAAGLSGLNGLQPALLAGAALTCAALAAARRARPSAAAGERIATALLALLLPAVALLLLPWTRQGIERGLTMLAARGWYRTIMEFRPLIPSGYGSPYDDLRSVVANHGLTPLAVVAALPLAWRRWRRGPPEERGPTLLFAVLAAGALVLGWSRNRFIVYLSLAEALGTALVARELAAAVTALWTHPRLAWLGRWPAGGRLVGPAAGLALAALLVAPVLRSLPDAEWAPYTKPRYAALAPLARLAGQLRTAPGRDAVLVPWSHGHDLRWFSGRPVVSSPFGIEGGPGALEVDAAFHRTTEQAEAEALLASRRVGLVVTFEPLDEIVSLAAFAPPGAREIFRPGLDPSRLDDAQVLPAFNLLVVTRLWLWDGQYGDQNGRPVSYGPAALDAFRLVGESLQRSIWMQVSVPMFKLFEPVPGARVTVRGAAPGARVLASTSLRTNTGRDVPWSTFAWAGPDGVASLRLPYATGMNGAVAAAPWGLDDGKRTQGLVVSERAVLLGEPLEVRLGLQSRRQ